MSWSVLLMLDKVLIYQQEERIYTFAYALGKLQFILLDDNDSIATESIFRARISKINHANHTAFIEYLPQQFGYINLPTWLKVQTGTSVLAQLTWNGDSTKQAKFRYGAEIVGKYLIYSADSNLLEIQAKNLLPELRLKLDDVLQGIPAKWRLRSALQLDTDNDAILAEANYLKMQAEKLQTTNATGLLVDGLPDYAKLLRNISLSADGEIITNSKHIYDEMSKLQDAWLLDVISYQSGLNCQVNIDEYNTLIGQSLVALANGCTLEIHTVSGITIIDVNSGSSNLTSAKLNFIILDEIYQQICLRNLQGIILIDVIKNMSHADEQKIILYLQKLFRADISKTKVLGFSNSGLLELIRNKF